MAQFFGNAVLDLFYPPVCFSCHESLLESEIELKGFCKSCLAHIEFMSYEDRCSKCFELKANHQCNLKGSSLNSFGCFDKALSPTKGLVELFKIQKSKNLATSIAAFLILQMEKLQVRVPDFVSFIPLTWQEKIFFDNLDQIVAKEVAILLNIPFKILFKAKVNQTGKEIVLNKNFEKHKLSTILLVTLKRKSHEEWLNLSQNVDGFALKVYLAQFLF